MQLAVAHPSGDERLVMRQTELRLTDEDRELVEGYRSKRPAPRTKGQSSTHSFGTGSRHSRSLDHGGSWRWAKRHLVNAIRVSGRRRGVLALCR